MDDLDREILDILRQDARTPYTDIAEELNVSEGTVRNRVEGLVEDGVIERFTVATRTGNVKAMVDVSVAVDHDANEVAGELAGWPEVDRVWLISGERDIVFVVDAADTAGVNEIITRARERPAVEDTTTRLILDERLA